MSLFKKAFLDVLKEDVVSGGPSSAFGSNAGSAIGGYGNQFPSQNDSAYARGDARIPFPLGAVVDKRKKKKKKILMQRRGLSNFNI
ncbi:hypothetical protein EBR43_10210 [bacterium]|nr:hypothetical protein [bacterium]